MGIKNWLGTKAKNLVGVDIGSYSVKVASLRKEGTNTFRLEALGKQVLPEDTVVEGSIISKIPLAECIESLFQENKIKENRVATAISGHSVIVKKVTLPALTKEELDESIQWEAEHYIPFDLAEVNVDYQIVREIPESGKLEVVLVAAKKEKISDFTSVIALAGKQPVIVDVDAFAVQNSYEVNYRPTPDTVAALLNIGATSMNINIVRGNECLFTRDIATGGAQYTEYLQEELGVTLEEAEKYKIGEQAHPEGREYIAEIIQSVSENLALEVEKTFDYFKTTTYSEDIQKLYICGGGSKTEGLRDYLADTFKFSVEYLDPLKKIRLDKDLRIPELSESFTADFAVAIGLALRTA